jgi:hypothetical protein
MNNGPHCYTSIRLSLPAEPSVAVGRNYSSTHDVSGNNYIYVRLFRSLYVPPADYNHIYQFPFTSGFPFPSSPLCSS